MRITESFSIKEVIFTAVAFVLLSFIARYSQTSEDVKIQELVKPQSLSASLPQPAPNPPLESLIQPLSN